MSRKIFKPITAGKATIMISIASFFSYLIGLFRDRIIAINFGTTTATDTYNASFLIPDFLFNLFIAGALSAAFLPVFSKYLIKDKKEAFRIANTVITGGTLLIAVLATIAFIFMGKIVPVIFANTEIEMQKSIILMTRIMLPTAVLFAISNSLGNILMSYKHFATYAAAPILYNLGIIIGVYFFNDELGIYAAATGVLIGAILHALVRIYETFNTDFKYRPLLDFSHPGLRKIIKLMIPKTISLISWQVNFYIFAIVGINMMNGGFAAFNFARNIQSFAVSLFGIAFATAIYPYLSTAFGEGNKALFTKQIQKTIQRILFFTIPSMLGMMLLSEEIIDLILGGGIFNESSVEITAKILFFFALAIPLESLSQIFARSFYATHNTKTPMLINIITMSIIASITLFIAPKYGIEWFSIGFSIGFLIYIILGAIFLRKKLEDFKGKEFLKSIFKITLASIAMVAFLIFSNNLETIVNVKLSHLLRILGGGGVYILIAYLLKSPEIMQIPLKFKISSQGGNPKVS
jgi:putative peptidoglycan lipid II flippase